MNIIQKKTNKIPQVVIVGRMNVGKSTLFNRLADKVRSITLDYEGVTRDFIKDRIDWQGVTFDIIDSGGIHLRKTQDELFEKVRQKVYERIEQADVLIFMVDATVGLLPEDREISQFLYKLGKPVILAINKVDSNQSEENVHEFERLGHTPVITMSAVHGRSVNDLLDAVIEFLPKKVHTDIEKPEIKVTFLGKPNVGKSSLMNALLKQERSIVSDIPGTTREAVSESIQFYSETIELTDTAGIRRKRAVTGELEPLMVKSSFFAMRETDIVVLLIDGSEHELADQELKLAFYAFEEHHKSLILLINKSDLETELSQKDLETCFAYYKHLIKKIPVMHISCKSGKNIGRVLPLIDKVWKTANQRFEDKKLNNLLISALHKKPLFHSTHPLRIYEVYQVGVSPITIVLKVNEPDWFGPSQLSFFENVLRSEYDMQGVAVKFMVRKNREQE